MSSSVLHSEHPELTCTICMQPFNTSERRPIDIGCHTFCEGCIGTSPSSFRCCPECRQPARNPHINYALMRLISAVSGNVQSASPGGSSTALQSLQAELTPIESSSGNRGILGWLFNPQPGSEEEYGYRDDRANTGTTPRIPPEQAGDARLQNGHAVIQSIAMLTGQQTQPVPRGGILGTLLSLLPDISPDDARTHAPTHARQQSQQATVVGNILGGPPPSPGQVRRRASTGSPTIPDFVDISGAPIGQSPSGIAGRFGFTTSGLHPHAVAADAGGLHGNAPAGPASPVIGGTGHVIGSTIAPSSLAAGMQHAVSSAVGHLPHVLTEVRRSFWSWAGPLLGLLYLISPLDLIPDFIPLLGWLDDMVVLGALIYWVLGIVAARPAAQAHRLRQHR